jgi:hypothetical protein
LKTWAKLAVEMVWSCLEWWKDFYGVRGPKAEPGKIVDFRHSPESVVCDWYESTCTQMIFLYNEIHKKFHDNATKLFQLLGKPRLMKGPGAPEASRDPSGPQPLQGPQALRGQRGYIRPSPGSNGGSEPIPLAPPPSDLTDSLRVASIDIGGGTTDISIITYVAETPDTSTPLIIPTQDFRDGFNVAGDDIMREIIRTEFIKMLENKAREKGVRNADDIITELFTDTVVKGRQEGGRRDKRKREQFVSQVAVPVALRILELYENTDFTGDDFIRTISLGEILETVPSTVRLTEVLGYVEEAMIKAGWRDIDLYNLSFQTDMRDVDAKVGYVIGQILRDMGEIIKYYDCDVLIMTGRPSRWPAIMRVPYERSFLPPDRIIHMHKYRVDSEYPFVSRSRIEDPKTSVVVGAVICHLASKGLNGIRIQTENLKPKPINRYMGRLYENDGKLDNNPNNLWFENRLIHKGEQHAQKVMIKFNTDTTVGFRQLGVERWTTTRLYRMEFADDDSRARSNGLIPYEIELEHIMTEADDPDDLKTLKKDDISRTEGTIIVRAIKNRLKNEVRNSDINIRLQTLRSRDGYWLDTGELSQY